MKITNGYGNPQTYRLMNIKDIDTRDEKTTAKNIAVVESRINKWRD